MSAVMSDVPASSTLDAISLLSADHDKARGLFEQYRCLKDSGTAEEKFELVKQVCGDLLIHIAIEEAIFYPPVRKAISEKDLVEEGEEEHEEAKELIRQLGNIDPASPEFDEKMQKLFECIAHHVEEEEQEMFPTVRASRLDLQVIGEELMQAKNEMRTRLGLPPEA